ncbi:MAG TPA: hypothetical protein VHU91_02525 [Mycobacteriales bacterium]|nr:hypothetical protein [Mycobacteriales bacterium]
MAERGAPVEGAGLTVYYPFLAPSFANVTGSLPVAFPDALREAEILDPRVRIEGFSVNPNGSAAENRERLVAGLGSFIDTVDGELTALERRRELAGTYQRLAAGEPVPEFYRTLAGHYGNVQDSYQQVLYFYQALADELTNARQTDDRNRGSFGSGPTGPTNNYADVRSALGEGNLPEAAKMHLTLASGLWDASLHTEPLPVYYKNGPPYDDAVYSLERRLELIAQHAERYRAMGEGQTLAGSPPVELVDLLGSFADSTIAERGENQARYLRETAELFGDIREQTQRASAIGPVLDTLQAEQEAALRRCDELGLQPSHEEWAELLSSLPDRTRLAADVVRVNPEIFHRALATVADQVHKECGVVRLGGLSGDPHPETWELLGPLAYASVNALRAAGPTSSDETDQILLQAIGSSGRGNLPAGVEAATRASERLAAKDAVLPSAVLARYGQSGLRRFTPPAPPRARAQTRPDERRGPRQ